MASPLPSVSQVMKALDDLKSVRANKTCFDCRDQNNQPTMADPKYGIFICQGCTEIHRELHDSGFTSVKSPDASWTWEELRQMQYGGNASANTFFRQHYCTSYDAKKRYKSKTASLYQEVLRHRVEKVMENHGYKAKLPTDEEKALTIREDALLKD